MTNIEKFIEIMNDTFDARFSIMNMQRICSPCGALKIEEFACNKFECEKCKAWWYREYEEPQKEV